MESKMLIFDENTDVIMLDSIHTPTLTEYYYTLDLAIMDFSLTPLLILEETVCPAITLRVAGYNIILPASWHILVCDEDTHQIDVIPMYDLAAREFSAMVYGPNMPYVQTEKVAVVDYTPMYETVSPAFNKHQMLCHPISPSSWINISHTDVYNKYLKNRTSGDIVD